ncbi:MAG: flagellar biosynthetic protein FliO [Treponema sp.]|jgi:flagellar protein FliO/FliZ|nr:flagellar biosynthetic protein FliO [Treponema sp.]
MVFAQTPDSPEAAGALPEGRAEEAGPSEESLIILGEAPPGEPIAVPEGPSFSVVLRMVAILALVAAAIYGVVFLFKRLLRPRDTQDPYLKILSRVGLGSNRFVYVISVGSKAWLVGAGEGGVCLIAELSDQEAVDAMLLEDASRRSESIRGQFPDFGALLRRLSGGNLPDKPGASPENVRKRRERLKDL